MHDGTQRVIRFCGASPDGLEEAAAASAVGEGALEPALVLARRLGRLVPTPGGGATADVFSVLATIAAVDLTTARVVEPHLDALAILLQAGRSPEPEAIYGVYAAERPGLAPVAAEPDRGRLRLTGTKPWCSLAGRLDRALITAQREGQRLLVDVDLHDPGARPLPGTWVSRGLAAVDSGDLLLDRVPGSPVGEPGWYVARPGFAWGGIGVAACWFGGAAGVVSALASAAARREPDQIGLAAIGEADRLLHAARCALEDAVRRIDGGQAEGASGALLALRVRGVVADSAERILALVGRALGPAPLTFDEQHARRVADLTVYLRQHHASRDDARAGRAVLSVV